MRKRRGAVVALARICSARRRLTGRRSSRAVAAGPRAGEQLGREQRVVVEALLEGDAHRERGGEEVGVGEALVAGAHARRARRACRA